ncbi:uncharacterized protein RSE6_00231 [Rhynchosporium secalis]|uniref:N-acetyltransferase domain-containing protein n=1 Tax=Rhynchosporium secalis TaxID=38038 RepID=A0A1E1LUP6_RHYSE|nr:uncharacterized protein RSE6_00231 [Rhynchosporium secalis]
MSSIAANKSVHDKHVLCQHVLSNSKPGTEAPKPRFALRPMKLADTRILGVHATDAYWDGPVIRFIAPHAPKYRADLERTLQQSIRKRLFDPCSVSLVAYEASNPAFPVGFGSFTRLGDDDGARAVLSQHSLLDRIYLFVFAWLFWIHDKVQNWMWPDRSTDANAAKAFGASVEGDEKKYWDQHPERKNRWHVQSIVISPTYQGKGIGRLLVQQAIDRAQQERVIMGLSSSVAGSHLYRNMGFELLGDFAMRIGVETGNGIMIRYPEGAGGETL